MKFIKILLLVLIIFGLAGCAEKPEKTIISIYHWDFQVDKTSPIYKVIKEKTGVDINPISAPWTDWPNKLNIMLTSGDIPDIFVTYGPGETDVFEKLAKEGMLLPLSPYLNKYPNIKRRLTGFERQKVNDEYYALPVFTTIDHTFFIRQDWLDECGLSLPVTTDDLYTIAKTFKEKYNINPISSSPPHTSGFFWLNPILFAFGGGWDVWIEENKTYIPCWISEGNKQALLYIQKLYKDGLLDLEFFSNTDNEKLDSFYHSRTGIMMHGSYPQVKNELLTINPTAVLSIFGLPEGPSGKKGMWSLDGFFTAVSINAKLKEDKIRKVLEFLDFLYSDEGTILLRYGVKGIHWEMNDNAKIPLLPKENDMYVPLTRIDSTAGLRVFIELGGVWYPEWETDRKVLNSINTTSGQYGIADITMYFRTESYKEYNKKLYDLTMKHYVKIVASANFEKNWKLYIDEFLSTGGDKMIAEQNK